MFMTLQFCLPEIKFKIKNMIEPAECKKIWEAARKGGFYIASTTPSLVCQELSYYMELPGRVLDIGCGQGRNSIFFARMGYEVDAIDIVDVFPRGYKEHGLIKFYNKDCREFESEDGRYLSIVATRFLHHIDESAVEKLLREWYRALQYHGNLALSFAFFGEPFEKVSLPFYHHDPEKVLALAEEMGFVVLIKKYINKVPAGINRSRKKLGNSFEVIFRKK